MLYGADTCGNFFTYKTAYSGLAMSPSVGDYSGGDLICVASPEASANNQVSTSSRSISFVRTHSSLGSSGKLINCVVCMKTEYQRGGTGPEVTPDPENNTTTTTASLPNNMVNLWPWIKGVR